MSEKVRECRESNPGLLGKKRERLLCASPPSLHANYAPLKRCIKISAYHKLFMITMHWGMCTARRMSWCFPHFRLGFTFERNKISLVECDFKKSKKELLVSLVVVKTYIQLSVTFTFFGVYLDYCNCKRNWRVLEKGKSKEQKARKRVCCSLNCENCGAMIRHWKSTLNSIREKVWEN